MKPEETQPASNTFPNTFTDLGLDPRLVSTLKDLGYEEATPIQREAIPPLLTGRDVIGQAATGTGKTAAFGLPMLQRISEMGKDRGRPSALILVPTRELAMQVAEAMHKYGHKLKTAVLPIFGGQSFGQQQRMLERGIDVVVATPGRAVDHIRRKTMDLSGIAILALDEADEMLDMGFAEDLETILSETPEERQTVFFSATLPPRIASMVKRHLKEPLRIEIATEKVAKGDAPKVRQTAYIIPRRQKLDVLGRVLDLENAASALIFCRTRTEVDDLTERLGARGYRAQALHGGIVQDQRTRVIKRLREGALDLVVATDVAARGLDIEQLELVVNYDVPVSPDSYVHRIGRVGRAGREGVAITLADPRESRLLKLFERQTKGKIEIAQVPTVADLRAHRLELTRQTVEEAIRAGNLDHFRTAVESLAQEHGLMDVALAALKLAHDARGGDGPEDEIESQASYDQRDTRDTRDFRDNRPQRNDRPQRDDRPPRNERIQRNDRPENRDRPDRSERPKRDGKNRKERRADLQVQPNREAATENDASPRPAQQVRENTTLEGPVARIYIGAGRITGIGPSDIVGAITGESGIPANAIGAIEVADKYSVVELSEPLIETVLHAMKKTHFKGRKTMVRRFNENKK